MQELDARIACPFCKHRRLYGQIVKKEGEMLIRCPFCGKTLRIVFCGKKIHTERVGV